MKQQKDNSDLYKKEDSSGKQFFLFSLISKMIFSYKEFQRKLDEKEGIAPKAPPVVNPIDETVTNFIRNSMFASVQKSIDSGYTLNKEQASLYVNSMYSKLLEQGMPYYQQLKEKNINIPPQVFMYFAVYYYYDKFEKKNEETNANMNILFEDWKENTEDKFFCTVTWNAFIQKLKGVQSDVRGKGFPMMKYLHRTDEEKHHREYNVIYRGFLYLMTHDFINEKMKKHITPEQYMESLTIMKDTHELIKEKAMASAKTLEYVDTNRIYRRILEIVGFKKHAEIINEMQQKVDMFYTESDIFNDIKNTSGSDFVEKNTIKMTTQRIKDNVENLPAEAKIIIDKISADFNNCLENKEKLSKETLISLEILWQEQLPKVIEKFVTIDPEYRVTMTHVSGKSPETLMYESLQNIADIMNDKVREISEEKISDLSVTHRHTQNIKNSMM